MPATAVALVDVGLALGRPDGGDRRVEVGINVPWEPTQDVGIVAGVVRLEVEHEADGISGAGALRQVASESLRGERRWHSKPEQQQQQRLPQHRPEPERVEGKALSPRPHHA